MSEGDIPQILRLILALVFVLSLMGGLALLLKKLGLSSTVSAPGSKRRVKVIENLQIDHRHRAIILECDSKQHLVLFGPNGDTVVDSDIKNDNKNAKTKKA